MAMLIPGHGTPTVCQAAGRIGQHTELMANQPTPGRRSRIVQLMLMLELMPRSRVLQLMLMLELRTRRRLPQILQIMLELVPRRRLPVHAHMQEELIVLVIALLNEQLNEL